MHAFRARRVGVALALVATTALGVAACGADHGDQPDSVVSGGPSSAASARGPLTLDPADPKPDLTLTDQDGKPYDLARRTAGHPTLIYFGYTHCPDVCPTTMGDLAVAARSLSATQRKKLRVVFVSTDPKRDTPERLKKWLGAIDPHFVGLTGDFAAVQKAAKSLGVGISPPQKGKDGRWTVSHGAEVIVFSPRDDKAHYLYTAGTSVKRYRNDMPAIIEGKKP